MTRVTIDRRKFLVKETPAEIADAIRDSFMRNSALILTTSKGIISLPVPRLHDFILTAETVKK